jgi:hypothetical protein
MKKSKQPKTHFVPKIVFKATFAGVVPFCVAAAACGGDATNNGDSGQDAANRDSAVFLGVAAIGFDAPLFSVAAIGFDGGVADLAFSDAPLLSVAAIGFDAQHYTDSVAGDAFGDVPMASVAFIGFDTGVRDASDAGNPHDASFGVADAGFRPRDGSSG